jgi:hypothetical protein
LAIENLFYFLLQWFDAFTNRRRIVQMSQTEQVEQLKGKAAALERVLGPMHPVVGHAPIPYHLGGSVDVYAFTHLLPGTVLATMELIQPDGSGPLPNPYGAYELVACTRLKPNTGEPLIQPSLLPGQVPDSRAPFHQFQRRFCQIFTLLGRYSRAETFSPGQTSVLVVSGRTVYLLFDRFDREIPFVVAGKPHHLLLCVEIFASECDYAILNGANKLLDRLKDAGVYPYSDMDRRPIY